MKQFVAVLVALFIVQSGYSQDNEKRIKFNSGTIKLCTQAHLTIKGYDGDEVIIKSLNKSTKYVYNFEDLEIITEDLGKLSNDIRVLDSEDIAGFQYITFSGDTKELEKGLKPLGKESNSPADDLFLDITENPGELIIKDYKPEGGLDFMDAWAFDKKYEILIPNSVKLLWNTDDCSKTNANSFFATTGSDPSELSDFKGEVEISFTYGSIDLTDVTGPVIANTLGGNIQVEFKNIAPTKLYSLISGNGYINIELPSDADLTVDASAKRILSDIDFEVLTEDIKRFDGSKKMSLKLNSGKVKMKLDAGSGSIYLRRN